MDAQLVVSVALASILLAIGSSEAGAKEGRITEREILEVQGRWGDAIVAIGKAHAEGKDYKAVAEQTVDALYGYGEGAVLFKPTKASEKAVPLNEGRGGLLLRDG